jgi:lipoyl(octanoyl) transferase
MEVSRADSGVITRFLGVQPYLDTWKKMQAFTQGRDAGCADELWVVQHPPVFTLGQASKPEHLLNPGDIPVVQTDRGGQVTYHAPGQMVCYPLLDLRRLHLGVRELVTLLEQTVIAYLSQWNLCAEARADAPGVYIDGKKIASLGLRVKRGCSFHGVSVNIRMDLTPFLRINPCGHAGLQMAQLVDCVPETTVDFAKIEQDFAKLLTNKIEMIGCKTD